MKKKKNYCLILIFVLTFCFVVIFYSSVSSYASSKFNGYTIVLDAGHGGRDGGCVGKNGTIEKEINLKYVYSLKDKLTKLGYKVELTRKTDDGLYGEMAKNKKISDMEERMKIIKKVNPSLVVSIHMNSFADSSAKGAVTYYKIDDPSSLQCANLIQQSLHSYCGTKLTEGKKGDYYILNASYYTSVLVECGFLSNAEEEQNLNSKEYMDKMTTSIAKGIMLYFGSFDTSVDKI